MKNALQVVGLSLGLLLTFGAVPVTSAQTAERLPDATVGHGETLEDFFTSAMDYNPRLRIAEDRWDIGSARRRAANGQLLPQVTARGSISDNDQVTAATDRSYRGERYSVQLSQVLFNWQAFARRSQAYLREDQAEAEYYAELAFVLSDVAEKYFNVLQAQDAVRSIQSELEAINNQAEQIQRLYDLRMAQITDLYDVQARQAAIEAEQLNLEAELALAKEALRAASGLTVGNLYQLSDEAVVPPLERTADEWVALARDNSPQIRAREFARRAADKQVSERRGAYMPSVALILQEQQSTIGFDNAPSPQTDTGYIGLDITIPLFAGGSNRAAVSEALSLESIARNELRQVELEVAERTRTAYLLVRTGESRTEAAERMAEAMELSATARQRGFELGTVTSVDVLNALRDQYQAERDLQATRYEHIKSSLILRREAGTLTAEDLLEVGSWLEPPSPDSNP